MGGDGGTLSHARQDQLRMFTPGAVPPAHTNPAASPATAASVALSTCALSREPLEPPVVVCSRGYLYNKAAVLVHLLSLKKYPPLGEAAAAAAAPPGTDGAFAHLSRRSDVMDVTLLMLPERRRRQQAPGDGAGGREGVVAPAFQCPITLREATGLERWLAIVPCGCVVSGAGWEGVSPGGGGKGGRGGGGDSEGGAGGRCPVCEGPVDSCVVLGGGKGAGGHLAKRPAKGVGGKTGRGKKRERRGERSDVGTHARRDEVPASAEGVSEDGRKGERGGVPTGKSPQVADGNGQSSGRVEDGDVPKRKRRGRAEDIA